MIYVALSLRAQTLKELGLAPYEIFFYRSHVGTDCRSCNRYYELLDKCPVRMPDNG